MTSYAIPNLGGDFQDSGIQQLGVAFSVGQSSVAASGVNIQTQASGLPSVFSDSVLENITASDTVTAHISVSSISVLENVIASDTVTAQVVLVPRTQRPRDRLRRIR